MAPSAVSSNFQQTLDEALRSSPPEFNAAQAAPRRLPGHIKFDPTRSPLNSPFTPVDDDGFDTPDTVSTTTSTATMIELPSDAKHRWWWDRIAPLLDSHLTTSRGYTPDEQASHMRVLRDVVIPTLGLPTPEASVTPLLTLDGSPFESSWNFQTGSDNIIRYTFEPLGDLAGTDADPYAGALGPSLIPILRDAANPPADMRWFEQLHAAWFVTPDEWPLVKADLPPHLARMPQLFTAFDMKGAQRTLKAYFFPMLKHIAHGTPTADIVFSTIKQLQPGGPELAPLVDRLAAYLATCKEPRLPKVEMMAIDCVDPRRARAKVYARTQDNSADCIADCMTLGGAQIDEVTLRGVEAMRKVWPLVLDEPAAAKDHSRGKAPRNPHTLHKGCCFVFELKAGAPRVEVKAHLPWCQFTSSDFKALENFEKALRTLGWDEAASKFAMGAAETGSLPGRDYNKLGGVSYVSYNYSDPGPYMSCYFSAMCQGYQ